MSSPLQRMSLLIHLQKGRTHQNCCCYAVAIKIKLKERMTGQLSRWEPDDSPVLGIREDR